MRCKIKVMLLICSALLMLGCASPALEHLEQGDTYFVREQWDEAIVQYTNAIELDPELAEAYNNRGSVYHYKGEFDNAIADYSRAIELDPNYDPAYYNRGNTYLYKGEFDNAIADYNKVIEVSTDPDLIQAAREAIIVLEGQ